MRLVFFNPHVSSYGKTVANLIVRQKNFNKYSYFLDQYLRNPRCEVAFLIDPKRSSFNEIGIRFFIFSKFFVWLEMIVWMLLNRVSLFRHHIYFSTHRLDPKNDLLFTFARNSFNNFELGEYEGIVLSHLTHYHRRTSLLTPAINILKHPLLVAESNLTHNDYFRHFFPKVSRVYQLPFTFAPRFKRLTPFSERLNKCLAIGSLVIAEDTACREFIDYFGAGTSLHPMRKVLYEHRDEIEDLFDVFIFKYYDTKNIRSFFHNDSLWLKFAKKYFPYFILSKLLPNEQASHLKLNLCEKQNAYRMFLCGEEAVGLPSNNYIEGMACGTAFVGIDHPMYTELGMKDGVNYIAYKEGDLAHLCSRIAYYQKHSDKLESIAEAGYHLAHQRFSESAVAHTFWKDLEQFMDSFQKGHVRFDCSFRTSKH